jgi:glutamine cyclotransferase
MSFSANGFALRDGPEILDSMPRSVAAANTPRWRGYIVGWHPHDMWAFSQGLVLHQGALYESTGITDVSSLRRVDPAWAVRISAKASPSTAAASCS